MINYCTQMSEIATHNRHANISKKIRVLALTGALIIMTPCYVINAEQQKQQVTKKTASGLRYTIIKQAPQKSRRPQKGQKAIVHYTGWLDEHGQPGKKFDSSVDRQSPFAFVVGIGSVIAGWDETVADMQIGEKRRVIIPANLGYGARGAGNVIPPHATLIFDIELLDIK